jgi:hypothetical protein
MVAWQKIVLIYRQNLCCGERGLDQAHPLRPYAGEEEAAGKLDI